MAINDAVKGKSIDSNYSCSATIEKVIKMLDKFDKWIDETPPTDQPQRFGNKSFRTWHEKLNDVIFHYLKKLFKSQNIKFFNLYININFQNAVDELKQLLSEDLYKAIPEIVHYLLEGFGNPTRIDYGTGHEMAFIMFLCSMFKINAFELNDKTAVGVKVFQR